MFTQTFIQTQIKENIKAPRHWPLCGEFTGTGEFPAQRASYAENVSIWWRHHMIYLFYSKPFAQQIPLAKILVYDINDAKHSSIGRDTIIFYACTMEVWHISSYFVIRTRLKDDIWPHLTLFRLFCDPDRGQDDIWPHLTQFNTSRDRGQVENCAIEPCLTSLTHLKRHEW